MKSGITAKRSENARKPLCSAIKTGLITSSLICATLFSLYTQAQNNSPETLTAPLNAEAEKPQEQPAREQLPLKELRLFAEVFNQIRLAYVNEVSDKELLENAIRGMLEGLDPHSAYLNEEDFSDLQVSTSGKFGGLGLEVGMDAGFVKVISPIDDTPAKKAGIEAGDLIIKLDNQPVKGMSLSDAVNIMRGEKGSGITLTIVREDKDKPFDLRLVRDEIKVTSVRYRELSPGFAYVRIANFQNTSGQELKKALQALQSKEAIKGLVLDLRNNPGGVLQAAVEVTDTFLEKNLVVYTKGRLPQSQSEFNANNEDLTQGAPLIVLINNGSASASEIVAGALQDHHRAIIMGTPSFGKGSVQTVLPIADKRAIKLTTALYYTPSGRSIQAEGIKPDILVERATITQHDSYKGVSEADLSGHLDNGNTKTTSEHKNKDSKDSNTKKITQQQLNRDNQLYEAFNLLKGIHINSLHSKQN
jgi:carboxyl-terminal processing protease